MLLLFVVVAVDVVCWPGDEPISFATFAFVFVFSKLSILNVKAFRRKLQAS
jgi:hypothetical protein